ncbi:FadR family transcriptional regulator [Mycobacterium eburneum]|nr:GntR family transcriptional regulator [Mycobacterium eburneum]TDH45991.1 FadR family transcriptional regulator [Mycobacterium eburneum]
MSEDRRLAPLLTPEITDGVRSPKTAQLVAATLRRMIVSRQLADGDFLPHESELMEHFRVSRPTLREAVRVLEAERLVEVRRGSRTGARVRVPGPEIVARPAALLLELSGATLADVMAARTSIEPLAAGILAATGTEQAHRELAELVSAVPEAWHTGQLAPTTALLHRRLVELSGNATLAIIAGMLHEIAVRHTSAAIHGAHDRVTKAEFNKLIRSYTHLVDLVTARNSTEAEEHWRRHMETAGSSLLKGHERTRVTDILNVG